MRLALLLLVSAGFAGAQASQATAKPQLHIRLTEAIGSSSPVGLPVEAVLIAPIDSIPMHSRLIGTVKQSGDASETSRASLLLHFSAIVLPNGTSIPIEARVLAVENAREIVDNKGLIIGIDASKTLESEAQRGIEKLSGSYSGIAGLLRAANGALFQQTDPNIRYPKGAELTLSLVKPAILPPLPADVAQPGPFPASSGLDRMVADQPIRSTAAEPPRPSDFTNILLIGSADRIRAAFLAAGWIAADPLNRHSKLETARAIAEDRGYGEGPVSLLMLEGQPPSMIFEKALNTFAARHHVRIWRRPGAFDGQPIWLAAATHDIAITFSEAERMFTHRIDSHIDLEREKVENDLVFTGMVRSLEVVPREMPKNATNATGDSLMTDGRIAVLLLQDAPDR